MSESKTTSKVNLLLRLLADLNDSDVTIAITSTVVTPLELHNKVRGISFGDVINNVTIHGEVTPDGFGSRLVVRYNLQIHSDEYIVKVFSTNIDL